MSSGRRNIAKNNVESTDEFTEEKIRLTGKSIAKSCLVLQVTLYFNIYFSPIYFATFYLCYQRFSDELQEMELFLLKTLLIIGSCIEVPRLYLGYTGNYTHRVPRILCFWLTTAFIQFPVQFLMRLSPMTAKPFLSTINVIMVIFLFFEITICFFVFRWLLKLMPKLKPN